MMENQASNNPAKAEGVKIDEVEKPFTKEDLINGKDSDSNTEQDGEEVTSDEEVPVDEDKEQEPQEQDGTDDFFVKNDKGEYERVDLKNQFEELSFSLKVNGKTKDVQGDQLIKLAQIGYNASDLNRQAKLIRQDYDDLVKSFDSEVERKSIEMAEEYIRQNFSEQKEENKGNKDSEFLVNKIQQLENMIKERETRETEERKRSQVDAEKNAVKQVLSSTLDNTVDSFKSKFEDNGKLNQKEYSNFVKIFEHDLRPAVEDKLKEIKEYDYRRTKLHPEEFAEVCKDLASKTFSEFRGEIKSPTQTTKSDKPAPPIRSGASSFNNGKSEGNPYSGSNARDLFIRGGR